MKVHCGRIDRASFISMSASLFCKRAERLLKKLIPLFLYILSDPGAQLHYGGSGERFPGFVEYSAKRRPRCRIPGRRCPRTILRP